MSESWARAQARLLRLPLQSPVGGSGITAVHVLVVELEDDHGAAGLGFSYCLGLGGRAVQVAALELLERFILGQSCTAPEVLCRRMAAGLNRIGRGAHFIALAAIDLAVWDLYARRLGQPLGIALGGRARAVPVYGSGGFRPTMSGSEASEAAAAYLERGVHAIKLRASGTASDAGQLDAIRRDLPADIRVMVDLNEKGDLRSAVRLAQTCADYGATWLEEPLPSDDIAGYRELTALCGVPLAAGEHWQGRLEWTVFCQERTVRFAQPDLAMSGGLTECVRIAQQASALGIEVAPHFLPSLFVHLAAAAPSVTWLEDFPLLEPLFADVPSFDRHGQLSMPATPGHGLRLIPDATEHFAAN